MNRLARLLGLGQSAHVGARLRLGVYAAAANGLSKALAFAVLILSTRVVLSNLGTERFGIWSTVSSVAVLLSFFDLGMPNALISRVATLRTNHDAGELALLISRSIFLLGSVGAAMGGVLWLASYLLPLEFVFKGISAGLVTEARTALSIFALLFGASLVAQAVLKIYSGLQLGWIANLVTGVGWALSAVLVIAGPRYGATMTYYLVATYGVQQLVGVLLLADLARRRLVAPRGFRSGALAEDERRTLLRHGNMFFIMQISVAAVWGSNQLILSMIGGPESAAEFSLLQRLFLCVQVGLAVLNAPLWAMYADAYARQETMFIRRLLARSFLGTIGVATLLCLCLWIWHRPLLAYAFSGTANVTTVSAGLMAIWTVLETSGNAYAMYLNGVGAIRPQVVSSIAYLLLGLPVKIAAAMIWGLPGLVASMIVSYILVVVLPLLTVMREECLAPIRLGDER